MTIQEIEQKLNECQKALAELKESKKESKKEGKWKPQNGDECHYRKHWGGFDYYIWEDTDTDNYMYNNIPMFPTKEECEKYWHFMDTLKEKSYEFSREEWEDTNIPKFYIEESVVNNTIYVDSLFRLKNFGMIYFKTEEDAQYIIDNFKDELMEYWI